MRHKHYLSLTVLLLLSLSSFVYAQDSGLTHDFTPHPDNPILPRGAEEAWDGENGIVFAPHVIIHEDTFYMFYSAADNPNGRPNAIGLATSEDGIVWEKYADNPILAPDGEGYDSMCISNGVPYVESDGTWVMYYAANAIACYGPGQTIARATAPTPEGPWTPDDAPLLESGTDGEWDDGFIMPHSIIDTDDGYLMYYSGGTEYLVPLPRIVGMATSSDGITWNKCNDPQTIAAPCAESDPIFTVDAEGDSHPFEAWAVSVLPTDNGYEMFYSSTCPDLVSQNCPAVLAYATSEDGVNWQTYTEPDERLVMPGVCGDFACLRLNYPAAVRVDDGYHLYFTGCTDMDYDCQIGLATGTLSLGE